MLLGMVIYEFAVGMCGIGWLHSQEWLCYWGVVICEFAVGMRGIGWLHSQEWLCYWGPLRS